MTTQGPWEPGAGGDLAADLAALRERLGAVDDPVALLAGLFAYAPVGFQVYRADGHSVLTNAAFRRLFGAEPPPDYNVLRDEVAERAGVLGLIRRAFAGETVHVPPIWYDPRELEHVRVEQANRVAVEAVFFPLLDRTGAVGHVAIAFRDVTAEIRAREEVEAERDRLRLALEAGGMGIWDWHPAAGRLDWSREVETLYGLAPGSFDGRYETFLGLIHPEDRDAVSATVAAAGERGGGDFVVEHRVLRPDGSERWVAGRGRTYLDEAGRVVRMVGTVVDVTDRKAALAEREMLLASEREARAEAEAALQARDEFLSVAAHELRTPVTGLRATAGLLRRQQERGALGTDRLERHLATIEHASRQLADLTTQLLDLSRLRSGQLPVDPRPTDLAALAGAVVEGYRDRLEGLELRLIAAGPCPALADPGRVEQILANLIENARKYSPEGGEVRVIVEPAGDAAEVRVEDEGIGLPPGAEERIFALFGRAPNAVERGIEGLGLGLYLCRRLAEAHGGSLHAASSGEGRGSTFTLRLPAAP